MAASSGGNIYVYHARVFFRDMRVLCTKLAITARKEALEAVRNIIKSHYDADKVLLSYEIHE